MPTTNKYKYTMSMKYMKKASKTYITIEPKNIEFCIIDRDYDRYNMPVIYMGINIDKNLVDDMITNEKNNLMYLEIYKYMYDEEGYKIGVDDLYVRAQCTYFMADDLNPNKEIDYATVDADDEEKTDIYRKVTIGLMKISLINLNKVAFNKTFFQTSLVNAVGTITKHIEEILIEPLTYSDSIIDQVSIYQDSVSKSLDALNKVKVFYSTPYRYFMDLDMVYLLSTKGIEVPRKGERIAAVLICIKTPEDYIGMDDGVYVNKSQGNYQINVSASSVSIYTDKLTDKMYNNIVAVTNSGDKVTVDLNIDKSSYGSSKTKTIYIPNDNIHMADNLKSQTENSGVLMTVCKESIDVDVFNPNHRIIVKNVEANSDKDGDYLMTRKREIFVRDGYNFILSTMVNLRKIR